MAKRACGYLSDVPRYGRLNFANFGMLAPLKFLAQRYPIFFTRSEGQGVYFMFAKFQLRGAHPFGDMGENV